MKVQRTIAVATISFFVVTGGLWVVITEYPFLLSGPRHFDVRYLSEWPISESDYDAALRLVEQKIDSSEIISRVTVPGPEEINVDTVSRWPSASEGGGSTFIIKKVNGEWVIAQRWVSLGGMV
jgi:hypothetical protein